MPYDTAAIRDLLTAAFDDEALMNLCYDHFHPVYESFATGMTKGQKTQALMDYCKRRNQFPALLDQVRAANPHQYAAFEARLNLPSTTAPRAPSPASVQPPRRRSQPKAQERNPFRYLRPVPPGEFLGRWPLLKDVALDLTLDEGDSYACIGGRRFGKSSLLAALHHRLRQPDAREGDHVALPLLLDFKRYKFDSARAFFGTCLQEVRRRVDAASQGRLKDPCPVQVSLDQNRLDGLLAGDPPSLSLPQFERALGYILDKLAQKVGGPTRLVLLLDEVDQVLDYPWHQDLFDQLRALIYSGDVADGVRLVLAGSRRFLDEVTQRGSPLWNVLQLHYLEAFDQAATYQLMERAPGLSAAAQEAVWRQSGGHPFLAQYLLHHLWKADLAQADETTVEQVANRFLHAEQAHLEGWARAISETGLRIYGQLVHRPGWVDEMELIRALGAQNAPVKRALVDLCYHGLVVHDEGWSRYRRAGELFRRWFLSKYPDQQKIGGQTVSELSPEIQAQGISFLMDIGRWAASELKERWTLARQKKDDTQIQVDLSEPEQARQQAETLLQDAASDQGAAQVERVLGLIERKRDLIFEWKEMKLDNEREYNHQVIARSTLRLRQKELGQKISDTLGEIEADLKGLGVQVEKDLPGS